MKSQISQRCVGKMVRSGNVIIIYHFNIVYSAGSHPSPGVISDVCRHSFCICNDLSSWDYSRHQIWYLGNTVIRVIVYYADLLYLCYQIPSCPICIPGCTAVYIPSCIAAYILGYLAICIRYCISCESPVLPACRVIHLYCLHVM